MNNRAGIFLGLNLEKLFATFADLAKEIVVLFLCRLFVKLKYELEKLLLLFLFFYLRLILLCI